MSGKEFFRSREEYLQALEKRAELPAGFLSSTANLNFFPREKATSSPYKMNLSLITLTQPTNSFAAVFTNNSFPGAPIIIGKERLKQKTIRGVIVNNKISNVCVKTGLQNANKILTKLGQLSNTSALDYFISSTGIIGWRLPVEEILDKLPQLVANQKSASILPVAQAIMTTDSYIKVRAAELDGGRILGIAKGAGMIEPNMSTLLVFLLTDLDIKRSILQRCLTNAVNESFNCISVDSDQSTSDTAIIFSSKHKASPGTDTFQQALNQVCRYLAEDIVRNGEGVKHVIKVQIKGAKNKNMAVAAGKAIINSPLVKTAIFGNDPNVGRIIVALGDYLGKAGPIDIGYLNIYLGNIRIFTKSCFCLDKKKEEILTSYLKECSFNTANGFPPHNNTVEIKIELGVGNACAEVIGADLSYDYVKENADYRT